MGSIISTETQGCQMSSSLLSSSTFIFDPRTSFHLSIRKPVEADRRCHSPGTKYSFLHTQVALRLCGAPIVFLGATRGCIHPSCHDTQLPRPEWPIPATKTILGNTMVDRGRLLNHMLRVLENVRSPRVAYGLPYLQDTCRGVYLIFES
jgi:hypothetical protein